MKTNMHLADRIVRILLSITIAILYFTGHFSGTLAVIALVVAIIFTLTSVFGFCPLYALFRISGKKQHQ